MTDPSRVKFESWVAAVATAQPHPPRSFDHWELARLLMWSRDTVLLSALGVAMVATAAWFISGASANPWTATAAVISVTGGLFLLLSPAAGFYRAARALRQGILLRATVLTVKIGRRGFSGGVTAEGERVIHHPRGDFRQRFAIAAPWKDQIRERAVLDVLVDPVQPKVLWEIGISKTSKSAGEGRSEFVRS
jgi:hypothetical protein